MSPKSSTRAGRVVRRRRADGTIAEYHYPAYQPNHKRPASNGRTVGDWMDEWERSPEFKKLAWGTQRNYRQAMLQFKGMRSYALDAVEAKHVIQHRNAIAEKHGDGAAYNFVSGIGAMFYRAVRSDWLKASPLKGKGLYDGLQIGAFKPWSEDEIALALNFLPKQLRRAVILARETGQRVSDLVRMKWSQYDGASIAVVQKKTKTPVRMVVSAVLKAELDDWFAERMTDTVVNLRSQETILVMDRGKPWRESSLAHALSDYLGIIPGFPTKPNRHGDGEIADRSIHGLRYRFAIDVVHASGTMRELMGMTGHLSIGMAKKYTDQFDREQAAAVGMAKLEAYRARRKG